MASYDEALRWIYERIDYERVPPVRTSPHFQLDRVRRQLDLIGAPQERIPCVHIAGTKGKGSTAAMVDSIMNAASLASGLFTSPHLERFEERMTVNGVSPDPTTLTELVAELQSAFGGADEDLQCSPPTYFEVATLLAWMYFDRMSVDAVVLETGLGGRLDCTNVCSPLVTVITNISLDHTSILGHTIEKIAFEKAGIMKAGVPLITGVEQPEVIQLCEARAVELQCDVLRLHDTLHVDCLESTRHGQHLSIRIPNQEPITVVLPLIGPHQAGNAALAAAAADVVAAKYPNVTAEAVQEGLSSVRWPLRFEVLRESPTIILDAAHNPAAATAVCETLNSGHWPERPRVLVFAASSDKDIPGILRELLNEFDHVVMTRYENNPRSCDPHELAKIANALRPHVDVRTAGAPCSALQTAQTLSGTSGLILATGSVFLAAECRPLL